jgi:predicted alpha/beta-fold hydrolase
VNTQFNAYEVQNFWKEHYFGFYDFALGMGLRSLAGQSIVQAEAINEKQNPSKVIGLDYVNSVYRCSDFPPLICAKVNNHLYKNGDDLLNIATVDNKMHKISKPFFFLSSADDPIMGHFLPVDKLNDNLLIGTTKYGGHCGYFTGKYVPNKQWFPEPAFEFLYNFVS